MKCYRLETPNLPAMNSLYEQDSQFLQVRIDFLKDLVARRQVCLFNAFSLLHPETLNRSELTLAELSQTVNEEFYKFLDDF